MSIIYKLLFLMCFSFLGYSLTQEEIDEAVSKKVTEVFALINSNWEYLYCNKEGTEFMAGIDSLFWEITVADSLLSLRLKDPTCNLVQALRELPTKKAVLDCSVAQATVSILCLLDLLGEEKFNNYVCELIKTTKINLTHGMFFHLITRAILTECSNTGFAHITNAKEYSNIKSTGSCSGYNGYIFTNQQFISFSPTHFQETKSIEQVQRILFDDIMSNNNVTDYTAHQELKQRYGNENGFDSFRKQLEEAQKLKKILNFSAFHITKCLEI